MPATTRNTWFFMMMIFIMFGVYLNRSYAYFYTFMSEHYQTDPQPIQKRTFAQKDTTKPVRRLRYAALGDSLTAGAGTLSINDSFPFVLGEKLSDDATVEVYNLGIPGAVSADIITHELSNAVSFDPDAITLLIGVNDIHNLVPRETFAKNLDRILRTLKEKTHATILVLTIPYLGTTKTILPPYDLYFTHATTQFNRMVLEISQNLNLTVIDLFAGNQTFVKTENFYSPDLFHPDKAGYALWANFIYARYHP